ncbi:hypothetical protein [Alteromonas sp. V450]|uniref:hypothetical protein n=1 Tax=Alteromonas sp. V450 TaxID=1912139 RepID=UPI0011600D33|nr:hypothetical protein [Alteromonas sp. V450]
MQTIKSLAKNPSLLNGKKHLFLLSHMRANTSLMGHLLGSHPEINGYYEMHIGYYSSKSLLRQKALYCEAHSLKAKSTYMFDKVLHNEHEVTDAMLTNSRCHFLISIRAPEYAVPSIVSLYRKAHPKHEFIEPKSAAHYYCQRLEALASMVKRCAFDYLYLDADVIKVNPSETLERLTSYLALSSPLTSRYEKMHNTGKAKAGDSSSSLMSGEIIQSSLPSVSLEYEQEDFFKRCHETYLITRETLASYTQKRIML